MNATRIRERLDELRTLTRGWCDGEGEPPTAAALATAEREALALAALGENPHLYPTPDGGVSVETTAVDVWCNPDGSTEVVS